MTDILEVSVGALVKQVENNSIADWSETKKKDFIGIFRQRSMAARFICFTTAKYIITTASNRKIISHKQYNTWTEEHVWNARELEDGHNVGCNRTYHCGCPKLIGGRSYEELTAIANERAENIIAELPSVKKALSIIQPDVAKKMDRRDELLKQGQALTDKLEEISEPISLYMLPDDTTVQQVRQMVEERDELRRSIFDGQDKIGREGCRLDKEINDALFRGIPELGDAILKVAHLHHEKGIVLDQGTRRVEEHVLFGDSPEALDALKQFEVNEVQVSETTKIEFNMALDRLKLLAPKKKTKKVNGEVAEEGGVA